MTRAGKYLRRGLAFRTLASLQPPPLSYARLEMRCDFLACRDHGASHLIAVGVHYSICKSLFKRISDSDVEERKLTRSLQEKRPSRENSALAPGHAIAEIVESNFLVSLRSRHSRARNLRFRSVHHRNWHKGSTGDWHGATATLVLLLVRIVEEAGSTRRSRRRLHLCGKIRAGIHGVILAVRIRHLFHVYLVEHDANANTCASLSVIDEDELASFGLGEIAKKLEIALFVFLLLGRSCCVRRRGARGDVINVMIHRWYSGSVGGLVRGVGRIEIIGRPDVAIRRTGLTGRSLMVVRVGGLIVLISGYTEIRD